jgi:hypothetical protein
MDRALAMFALSSDPNRWRAEQKKTGCPSGSHPTLPKSRADDHYPKVIAFPLCKQSPAWKSLMEFPLVVIIRVE